MKINLGSNNVIYPDYINVDIRDCGNGNIIDDYTKLTTIEDESVSEIIAHNVLHQNPQDRITEILELWYSKLKKDGWISIGVPDLNLLLSRLNKREYTLERVAHGIFGNMGLYRQWHGEEDYLKFTGHSIFTTEYLTEKLLKAGFRDITIAPQNHGDCVTVEALK